MQKPSESIVFYSTSAMLALLALGFAMFVHFERDQPRPAPAMLEQPDHSVGEVD